MHSRKYGRGTKFLFSLLAALIMLNWGLPPVGARSMRFTELVIEAEILSDGRLSITERRTADFKGGFSGMFQWIKKEAGVSIEEVVVGEDKGPYLLRPEATSYGPASTYYLLDEDKHLYVDWSFEAKDEVRTFVLSYLLKGQVKVHEDTAELYYQFVGDEWDYGIDSVAIILNLPAGVTKESLRAWGHGPRQGQVSISDSGQVIWTVKDLPAATFLEGRLTFPAHSISGEGARITNEKMLSNILAQEERWAREANRRRLQARGALIAAVLTPLLAVFWSLYNWRLGGQAPCYRFSGGLLSRTGWQLRPCPIGGSLALRRPHHRRFYGHHLGFSSARIFTH